MKASLAGVLPKFRVPGPTDQGTCNSSSNGRARTSDFAGARVAGVELLSATVITAIYIDSDVIASLASRILGGNFEALMKRRQYG